MTKKILTLFKIGRKLVASGVISSISDIYNIPVTIKCIFYIFGFSLRKSNKLVYPSCNTISLNDLKNK